MFSEKASQRVVAINKKIGFIQAIVQEKGSYELRNFIAHDYAGVDLYIVEDVIEQHLDIMQDVTKEILK